MNHRVEAFLTTCSDRNRSLCRDIQDRRSIVYVSGLRTSEHFENMPMQYITNFRSCKNDNFQMKNTDVFFFFAQNIDCGYTLEQR